MNFEASRAKAIEKLNNFIENNLSDYSKLRNFDFGPENRSNISCLSPYITHGIINEKEVIEKSLNKFSFSKNEKFIQEVLWRTYWKGWLELRPSVWTDYLIELSKIRKEFKDNESYLNAINGKTNIECFDAWVNELKENNYLHNHSRMWFASIWIFTLELPWQLGAEFFMQHLYDGDAASNTLGWRWVAGIQTQGKHYLASEWNIKKFSNNRFSNIKLNENTIKIEGSYVPEFVEIIGGSIEMLDETIIPPPEPTYLKANSFSISRTEVTFKQFDAFCVATNREKPDDSEWGRGDRPVINITYADAIAYCDWLGSLLSKAIRLPTVAEWEYAARGGVNGGDDNLYSGSNILEDVSWCKFNSNERTQPVGLKKSNQNVILIS